MIFCGAGTCVFFWNKSTPSWEAFQTGLSELIEEKSKLTMKQSNQIKGLKNTEAKIDAHVQTCFIDTKWSELLV